jgi:protein-disulfide isomerase
MSDMPGRHMIAVASVVFGLASAPLAPGQSEPAQSVAVGKAQLLRTYLKIADGRPALVAFMDFQCPACQKNWPKIKAALDRHPEIKFYSVDFPLTAQHKNAFSAAVAYEIGRSRGAEDSTFDDLLSGKQSLDPSDLNVYLKAHNLPDVVGTAKATEYEARVNDQVRFAHSLGVTKTPTLLLINQSGKLIEVENSDKLRAYLQ